MKSKHHSSKKIGDTWPQEGKELMRGAAGGFLFGVPLLYTMEVWFIGSYIEPPVLLGILMITFIVIFLLNRVEGFRPQESATLLGAIAETIETLAIAIICATMILIVLQRIQWGAPLNETLGKVIFEAVPCAIGVALSHSILSGEPEIKLNNSSAGDSSSNPSQKLIWTDTLADLSATLVGVIFVAFSIAPTDEIDLLASAATAPWLLLIIFASLLITYVIVFAAGFTNQSKRRQQQGIFQKPQSETLAYYLISLFASALMLWFFQKLSFQNTGLMWLRYSIVLSLPASIGGAAGRLAV